MSVPPLCLTSPWNRADTLRRQVTTRGTRDAYRLAVESGLTSHHTMSLDAGVMGGSSRDVKPSTQRDITAAAPGCEACLSAPEPEPENTNCFAEPLSDLSDSSGEDERVLEVRRSWLREG